MSSSYRRAVVFPRCTGAVAIRRWTANDKILCYRGRVDHKIVWLPLDSKLGASAGIFAVPPPLLGSERRKRGQPSNHPKIIKRVPVSPQKDTLHTVSPQNTPQPHLNRTKTPLKPPKTTHFTQICAQKSAENRKKTPVSQLPAPVFNPILTRNCPYGIIPLVVW